MLGRKKKDRWWLSPSKYSYYDEDKQPLKGLGWVTLIALLFICLVYFLAFCCFPPKCHAEEVYSNEAIANAIYKAENSVKYPYGIKSINTHGDKAYARKICLNTIAHAKRDWDGKGDFIQFLGYRFCPASAHPLNRYWVKNVRYFLRCSHV